MCQCREILLLLLPRNNLMTVSNKVYLYQVAPGLYGGCRCMYHAAMWPEAPGQTLQSRVWGDTKSMKTCVTAKPLPSRHICLLTQHFTFSPFAPRPFFSVFCPRSALWDAFQIPLRLSYQPGPTARLVFTLSRAPPCYHGDAAVTCQLHGGDADRPGYGSE